MTSSATPTLSSYASIALTLLLLRHCSGYSYQEEVVVVVAAAAAVAVAAAAAAGAGAGAVAAGAALVVPVIIMLLVVVVVVGWRRWWGGGGGIPLACKVPSGVTILKESRIITRNSLRCQATEVLRTAFAVLSQFRSTSSSCRPEWIS